MAESPPAAGNLRHGKLRDEESSIAFGLVRRGPGSHRAVHAGIAAGAVLLLWLGCGLGSEAASGPGPCVAPGAARTARGAILILIDTLRADHVGLYGGGALTPRLDAFGASAVVFRRAYATSSWTRPSVGSIFSGLYPGSLGLYGRFDSLPSSVPTLAEELQREGIATFAISTNRNAGREWGFARGFDSWHIPKERRSYPGDFAKVPAEVVTRDALTALDRLIAEAPDRKFFGFLHYIDPHDPYLLHEKEPEESSRFDGSRKALEALDALPAGERTAADEEHVRALYRGEVRYVDHWVGALLEGLEARGLNDDLLVIATSDHGEGLFDHGRRAHGGKLYEDQIRIPLLVKVPAALGIPAGGRDELASLVDLAPTVLAAFGLSAGGGVGEGTGAGVAGDRPGRDLLACPDPTASEDRPVYAEISDHGHYYEALRQTKWKLIRNRAHATENRGRTVTVRPDDTLWKIAWRNFGGSEAVVDILAANPERFTAGTKPEHAKLVPGERLRLPDRLLGPGVPETELFDVAHDPKEASDLSSTSAAELAARVAVLERERGEVARRAVSRETVQEPLPEHLTEELRGLGYVE